MHLFEFFRTFQIIATCALVAFARGGYIGGASSYVANNLGLVGYGGHGGAILAGGHGVVAAPALVAAPAVVATKAAVDYYVSITRVPRGSTLGPILFALC